MVGSKGLRSTAERVARHRRKVAADGCKRLEVTVPKRDTPLVKAIAHALRSGDSVADEIRRSLRPTMFLEKAETGPELVAFLRASPLVGAELGFERDRGIGREIDLG